MQSRLLTPNIFGENVDVPIPTVVEPYNTIWVTESLLNHGEAIVLTINGPLDDLGTHKLDIERTTHTSLKSVARADHHFIDGISMFQRETEHGFLHVSLSSFVEHSSSWCAPNAFGAKPLNWTWRHRGHGRLSLRTDGKKLPGHAVRL